MIEEGVAFLIHGDEKIPLKVFGKHNLENIEGARLVCNTIGISDDHFYQAIQSFEGAANRLELISGQDDLLVFKDFAHAPSKLKATIDAVK